MTEIQTNFSKIIDLVHSAKDKKLLEDFLIALTTPYERYVLTRRVEIINRLLAGETQHQIASDLKIGVSTVTRGQRELNLGRFKILRPKKKS